MLFLKFILAFFLVSVSLTAAIRGADFNFMRDPFVPQAGKMALHPRNAPQEEPEEPALAIKLTGIIWDENTPFAMFDTPAGKRITKEGDHILGWDVKDVKKDQVVLKRDTKTLIVRVGKEVAL